MQCAEVRVFMSQIAAKSPALQVSQADLNFLSSNGYLSVMQKDDYDKSSAEVANLTNMSLDLQNEMTQESSAETALKAEEKKTHSIMFHFENKEKKAAELENVKNEETAVSKEEAELVMKNATVNDLIHKKSVVDRMVPYNGEYISLTGLGVTTLNDLNVRSYRVSANQFSDFIEESKATSSELRGIADKASYYASFLAKDYGEADPSQVWSVSVGLGKLQGDPNQIGQRFLLALGVLQHFGSTLVNKMMAAEIMTSFQADSSQPPNSDLQSLTEVLANLDQKLRHDAKVPDALSTGVAAIIMYGKRFDGTYPTDRFVEFSKRTSSFESAAILALMNTPTDQLLNKFEAFRGLFNNWGYELSEDTELASAYLSISDLEATDVNTKLTIIVDALKTYLEYPLVASAILASIPTLEANETLDLMQKAYSIIGSYAPSLEQSELLSLSVLMIHGIKNELVKELDPTAKIANTPMQFTHMPSNAYFLYHAPIIVAHTSYYSTFSGIGGFHPAHVHGVGVFMG